MPIDAREVRRIAALARLQVASVEQVGGQLQSILDHVALLDEVDVTGVEPTFTAHGRRRPLREDTPEPSLSNADALSNAPQAAHGHFRVPQILK